MSFESQTKKPTFQLDIILLTIIGYAILIWIFGDKLSAWSIHANPFLAVLIYLIINPLNWYVVFTLTRDYKLIGFISSVLIVTIIDIISFPHSLNMNGTINEDALSSYSDLGLWNGFFNKIHPGMLATALLYVLLVIIVIFLLLIIIKKPKKFVDIFKRAS